MNLSKAKARKMLQSIAKMSSDASMTGNLSGGYKLLWENYNKIRDAAIKNEWIDEDLVVELHEEIFPSDAEWTDTIGVAAKLFLAMLEDDDE